jgi:hypothetical protein
MSMSKNGKYACSSSSCFCGDLNIIPACAAWRSFVSIGNYLLSINVNEWIGEIWRVVLLLREAAIDHSHAVFKY